MRVRSRNTWRPRDLLLMLGMLAVAGFLHRQALADIVRVGLNDAEQSHIFLAPIVAVWLLWLRRSRLRWVSLHPSLWGPAVVAAGWFTSWLGFIHGVQVAWHGGALVSALGVVFTFTGLLPLRLFGPVFLVLVFMLPIPGQIRFEVAYRLQEMATSVTYATLEIIGINAVKSGNVLIINGEQIAVGEACNGMRLVFALTLVVFAFVFGTPLRASTRVILLLLSPLVAMLCNVIRLVPTSLIFGYGSVKSAEQFHDAAGWVMLFVAFFMLAGVLRMFRWLELPVTSFRLASR